MQQERQSLLGRNSVAKYSGDESSDMEIGDDSDLRKASQGRMSTRSANGRHSAPSHNEGPISPDDPSLAHDDEVPDGAVVLAPRSGVGRGTSTIGSLMIRLWPIALVLATLVPLNCFTPAFTICIGLWLLFPVSIRVTSVLVFDTLPRTSALAMSTAIALTQIANSTAFHILCRVEPSGDTPLISSKWWWELSGHSICLANLPTDTARTQLVAQQFVPPILLVVTSVFSIGYRRTEQLKDFSQWPAAVSIAGGIQFVLIRVMEPHWLLSLALLCTTMLRCCLLAAPLLLYAVVRVVLGVTAPRLSAKIGGSTGAYWVLATYATLGLLVYALWFAFSEFSDNYLTSPPTWPSRFADLVLGSASPRNIPNDAAHFVGFVISAHVASVASATPSHYYMSAKINAVQRVCNALTVAAIVLNPILLFISMNVSASIIGVGWAILWVLSVALPPTMFISVGAVFFGLLHLVAVFVAAVVWNPSTHNSTLVVIGLTFHDVPMPVAVLSIIATTLYNAFYVVQKQRLLSSHALDRVSVVEKQYPRVTNPNVSIDYNQRTESSGLLTDNADELATQNAFTPPLSARQEDDGTLGPARESFLLREATRRRTKAITSLVSKYFYVVAFLALFVAAVVKVDEFHLVFLVFFAVIVSWRPIPQLLWTLLVIYSVILSVVLYSLAIGSVGGFTQNTWYLSLYFLLNVVFLVQLRIGKETTAQQDSFTWATYIPIIEKLAVSAIGVANLILFGIIASTQEASIVGFIYLVFFVVGSTLLFATSFHSPPKPVRIFWTVATVLVSLIVLLVYMFHLSSSTESWLQTALRPIGLTPKETGLTDSGSSQLGLWPKVVSLMLSIVQLRVWGSTGSGAEDHSPSTSEPRVLQVFKVLRRIGSRALHLVSVYSMLIAGLALFIAGVFAPSTCSNYSLSLVNAVYFSLAMLVSVSHDLRNSTTFWKFIHALSSALAIVTYVLQLPGWSPDWTSGVKGYVGFNVACSEDELMWRPLSAHLLVFAGAVIYANAPKIAKRQTVADADGAVYMTIPDVDDVAEGDASLEKKMSRTIRPGKPKKDNFFISLYTVLANPEQFFYRVGYYLMVLTIFFAAMVRSKTMWGVILFLIDCAVASTGRPGVRKFGRMAMLSIFSFLLLAFQYVVAIGLPPGSTAQNPLNVSEEMVEYMDLKPSTWDLILWVVVWAAISMERISLTARKKDFHPFWGFPRGHVAFRLRMTDRLSDPLHQKIVLARQHNARSYLRRLLGLTTDEEQDRQQMSSGKQLVYEWSPLTVLLLTLIYSVYDATEVLSIPKLISLLVCLVYLHLLGDLPWRGNVWWRWGVRYHTIWILLRLVYNVPGVAGSHNFSCVLRYLGLIPPEHLRIHATLPNCPGIPYTVADVVFHAIVMAGLWIQSSNYDNAEYAVVLWCKHCQEVDSAALGVHIRSQRARLIKHRKQIDRENQEARHSILERIRKGETSLLVPSGSQGEKKDYLELTERHPSRVEFDEPVQHSDDDGDEGEDGDTEASPGPLQRGPSSLTRLDSGTMRLLAEVDLGEEDDDEARTEESMSPRSPGLPPQPPPKTFKRRVIAAVGALLRAIDNTILWLDRHSINPAAARIRLPIKNRVKSFLVAFYRFLLTYTDLMCYVLFCFQFALSPCLVSAPLPVSVFVYAAVISPRPASRYWSACLIYLQGLIGVKSLFKVAFCHTRSSPTFLAFMGRTCTADYYLVETLSELLCITTLLLHIDHLRRWGLWQDTVVGQSQAPLNRPSSSASSIRPKSAQTEEVGSDAEDIDGNKKKGNFVTRFLRNLTDDAQKIGVDFYKRAFSLEFLSLLFVFFAYYKLMGIESTFTESLKHSILPGGLSVTLIILFLLIVFDRVIYLGRQVLMKFAYDAAVTLLYHGIMIWWFNHQVLFTETFYRESSFFLRGALPLATLLYFLKCGYLYLGAAQIRHGPLAYSSHIVFRGNYGTPEFIFYYIGRLIPFVFDLRVVLDWTASKSSLKLGYWLKFEDICHELYLVLVDRKDTVDVDNLKKDKRRDPYPKIFKYPIGLTFFILLSVILLFPLLLYSSYSPVIQRNSVTSLQATLSLEGTPPLWESANRFLSRRTEDGGCCELNSTVTGLLERTRPSLVGLGLTKNTVQLLTTSNYSSTLWSISPPALQKLYAFLDGNNSVSLTLQISVQSKASESASTSAFLRQEIELTPSEQRNMSAMLRGTITTMKLPRLYTPFLFNYPDDDFQYFQQPIPKVNLVDCFLSASADPDSATSRYFSLWCHTLFEESNPTTQTPWNDLSPEEWFCLNEGSCPNYEQVQQQRADGSSPGSGSGSGSGSSGSGTIPSWEDPSQDGFATSPFYVIIMSNSVLSASILQSIGIVAAYTTFVLAIGRVLRFVVVGGAFRVSIEDMEDPGYLVALIEYLFIARAKKEFDLEMDIYKQIVDTLRVTEKLEQQTRAKPKTD